MFAIAGQQLAMVAEGTAHPALRIEDDDVGTCLAQRGMELRTNTFGAEGVEQHAHFDAALPRAQQCRP